MKKTLFVILCLLCGGSVMAQHYNQMWKQAEAALADDQPQTALNCVRQIRHKAETEHNMPWRLKALLTEVRLQADISPDSAKAAFTRLETVRQSERNPLNKAIIAATMARLYAGRYDTASVALVRRLSLEAAGQAKGLAEAKSRDFMPLLKRGDDSRHFSHDMLSVVVKEALEAGGMSQETKKEIVGRAIAVYRQTGRREAVVLLSLDSIAMTGPRAGSFDQSTDIAALKRLAEEAGDLDVGVEIYIALTEASDYVAEEVDARHIDSTKIAWAEEGLSRFGKAKRADVLRHFIASKTRASLSLSIDRLTLYPGETCRAAISHRAVGQWRVRFYRLEGVTAADQRLADEKKWGRLPRREDKKAAVAMKAKAGIPPYVTTTDSLSLCLAEPGVYYAVLEADGKTLDGQLVYVSRILPLTLSAAGQPSRVSLVDRKTGRILADGASITAYRRQAGRQWQMGRYVPDAEGEITISATKADLSQQLCFAETATDRYYPSFTLYLSGRHYAAGDTQTHRRVNIFTDRAIYRPGDEVLFGGFAHSQRGDDATAISGLQLTVTLTDARGEHVADTTLCSDEWGSFGGRLALPQITLPGWFTLSANAGGSVSLRVEEYKRPTFTVSIQGPEGGAELGKDVTLAGVAETYTGLPVAGAKVVYSVKKQNYWRQVGETDEMADVNGTATTDSLGRFAIPLRLFSRTQSLEAIGHLQFVVTADVTATNGETQTATHHIWASHRSSWLSVDWPATLCKERLPKLTVAHTANTGCAISSKVLLTISAGGRTLVADTIATGRPFVPVALAALPSGRYDLALSVDGADTLRRRFTLFSTADTRPADKAAVWWFDENKNATADSAAVVVGTALKDATLFVDRFDNRGRVSHQVITLSDTLMRFNLAYRPEMGDGERVVFTLVRDGQIHSDQVSVTKPLPHKQLRLSWHTFRDRLTPGSHETWQLRVAHPDGRPAAASVLARLYDASLDALASSPWHFSLSFSRSMPFCRYSKPFDGRFSLSYVANVKWRTYPALSFTRWFDEADYVIPRRYYAKEAWAAKQSDLRANMVLQSRQATTDAMVMTEQSVEDAGSASSPSEAPVATRSNFAETAYFAATLTTDSAGLAALDFILPERLTSWRFNALAHTQDMAYGSLDTTLVARRELMIEPSMPRFVRSGDCLVIPYTLRSLLTSADHGQVCLTITDGESGKQLYRQDRPFGVEAEGTVEGQFEWKAASETSFVEITLTATTATFSDGERHLLPLLPARVVEAHTLSLTLDAVGTTTRGIDTLWNKSSAATGRELLVETTSAPIWSAVSALPALAVPSGEGATEALTAYYTATMASWLVHQYPELSRLSSAGDRSALSALSRHPEVRQTLLDETPWMAEAKSERERLSEITRLFDPRTVAAYRATALARLQTLQNTDGSLSWYPGMSGSLYVTLDVASRLSRLSTLAPDTEAARLLVKARTWLEAQLSVEVKEMKRRQTPVIRDHHTVYLHLVALADRRFNATASWLARQALAHRSSLSMQSQALLAEALAVTGETAAAASITRSLTEHLVTSPEMGSYFDTRRAALSRESYRVPTQCAAINALTAVDGRANDRLVKEMQRWLVQSRRTQMWTEPRAACDVIYALMLGVDSLPAHSAPLRYTLSRGRHILAVNAPSQAEAPSTLGYTFNRYTDAAAADRLTIHKSTSGLSFAHVTARQTLPLSEAKATASGMQLTCRYERWDGNRWQVLGERQHVEAGERIRQVLTLEAERDYDFVSVTTSRGANAQPRRALSGYASWGDLWGYRAVRDASTSFYIEHLAKGTHTFTEEFVVDRPGRYTYGVCRAACEYAPEYHSQTPAFVMGQ